MNNLSIEGLGNSVSVDGVGTASNASVLREMREQGMKTGGADLEGGGAPDVAGTKNFVTMMQESLANVNKDQLQADTAIKELIAGRSKNIHETMLTVERADSSLKMAMQVRNKILDAYREIMRMQV